MISGLGTKPNGNVYPASRGPFDLPKKSLLPDLSRKIKGTSAHRVGNVIYRLPKCSICFSFTTTKSYISAFVQCLSEVIFQSAPINRPVYIHTSSGDIIVIYKTASLHSGVNTLNLEVTKTRCMM